MKKSIISFCGLVFIALLFMANTTKAENPLTGSWDFNVNQAPWEYSRGKLVFEKDKDDEIAGEIIFSSGIKLKIPKITLEDKKMTFEVTIDGYNTKTVAMIKDDNLTGHVSTFEGDMPFTAKRSVPED